MSLKSEVKMAAKKFARGQWSTVPTCSCEAVPVFRRARASEACGVSGASGVSARGDFNLLKRPAALVRGVTRDVTLCMATVAR